MLKYLRLFFVSFFLLLSDISGTDVVAMNAIDSDTLHNAVLYLQELAITLIEEIKLDSARDIEYTETQGKSGAVLTREFTLVVTG